mmetsp:Transcript_65144/g.103715  ORF Transcript_65144/g.103715 Transcript_65144/m.103715 type:complete len:841 (+) Transcript_65144:35-2557(+)|eukprot:CAMPEP_0197032926 /NCGR_PEP_ID=MMETSP1384-20130603/11461_1 /TAXON_ID=29189 /ORGANISM="Ammonia sp." /LENGTH=840 /DNA_ID=CAMNT_0042462655 /DNA_START=21 /DNA_END=2543 /DNA_ORIENTATION=-
MSQPTGIKVETEEEKKHNDVAATPKVYSQKHPQHVLGSPVIENRQYEIFKPDQLKDGRLYKYDYRDVHADLEKQHFAGVYGWDNACYWGIAERIAKTDLTKHYSKRHSDEVYLKEWTQLLEHKKTQKWWPRIVTFDPLGMTATNPTIAATTAILNIPELANVLKRDGVIVDEDGGIATQKAAVYPVWNIPALAKRLELSEFDFRDAMHKYTGNPSLLDKTKNAFLPNVGGVTVYTFGDVSKIRDPKTEIAVRVHDECNGSDVFGTDICTCRPYLIFALHQAIECAQRGGVGVVAYFRKEGRSLGEITKYRVYNARKYQAGGDRAEMYFAQTEKIAGIKDARFQTMMPDVLNWLGIDRIDWLLSMSSEKYDAIIESGITVNQRVPLPDSYVPKHAKVEVLAKIAAGYHAESTLNAQRELETLDALRDLRTIRKQCSRVFKLAKLNKLTYFTLNIGKFDEAVKLVTKCINEHYPDLNIPLHSRFRHFNEKAMSGLMASWQQKYVDKQEQVRRLVDLVTISVLLDAGAGADWKYISAQDQQVYSRSEGLALASFDMFAAGLFSSDPQVLPTRVNSIGLIENMTLQKLQIGFQVSKTNPMIGLNGRYLLLKRLGSALELEKNNEYFGCEVFRPGHLLDYLLRYHRENSSEDQSGDKDDVINVSIHVLWKAIIEGFETIWPKQMSGIRRGDVWVHNKLKKSGIPGSDMIPFHKLQQWLTYSLVEAFEFYGINFLYINDMTCLAEYRNGGLFVDTGVLTLKHPYCDDRNKYYDVGSELVVEWRAMTIVLCDKLAERLRVILHKSEQELGLAKVLEGGSWRAGRELAFKLRKDGSSPINLRSDGTVF